MFSAASCPSKNHAHCIYALVVSGVIVTLRIHATAQACAARFTCDSEQVRARNRCCHGFCSCCLCRVYSRNDKFLSQTDVPSKHMLWGGMLFVVIYQVCMKLASIITSYHTHTLYDMRKFALAQYMRGCLFWHVKQQIGCVIIFVRISTAPDHYHCILSKVYSDLFFAF